MYIQVSHCVITNAKTCFIKYFKVSFFSQFFDIGHFYLNFKLLIFYNFFKVMKISINIISGICENPDS